jgi:ubiquinone/menaquinone biosynthesis C-methylase UbiE
MSYTIDERNPERQQLLAAILNPPTRQVLARLPELPNARCLDLGCGQGNTTRCLADVLEPAACIGLEYDADLVEYANTRPDNPPSVRFQRGDATQLTFADASFDIVFCRYLLIHMADPVRVVREMMRVLRPGGYAVAFEGDFSIELSYPACDALASINKVWHGLFQNPLAGRKLVHYFREVGATEIQAGALMQLEHGASTVKRLYRLTAEATGPTAEAKGVLTAHEVREMIAGLVRLEDDPSSVFVKFPDMWVIARRLERFTSGQRPHDQAM